VSFTVIAWDIDTSNASHAGEIAGALKERMRKFGAVQVRGHAAVVRTSARGGIDAVRDELDAISGEYLGSFYYLSIDVPDDDPIMAGNFPKASDLDAARKITGDASNPFQRDPTSEPQTLNFAVNVGRGARSKK
jgi:hypothetical protein